ncbi:CU044_2847 family protein [Streptomyces bambusae]|uniref:CU044_2847 family protein n=1 Tax=Streptomyces bambusae TaxID=1550616 RepID=UPI001CA4F165|nr:CU044_2847 family protein [Streptomyces bambusae]
MAYLVELPVSVADAGGAPRTDVVKVEIEQVADGLVEVARPGQVVARATRSLGDMLAGVRPIAQNFVDSFRGMACAPDEISVEFGLSLSAEADVVISSTAAQAHFAVSLTWNRPGAAEPAQPAATAPDAVGPAPAAPAPARPAAGGAETAS